jgi:GNAT superfamily N-acetyltransferase
MRFAETDQEIRACHAVMAQLRPQLGEAQFVEQVKRQQASGYRLAYLEVSGLIVCVAGLRLMETLAWGRVLYVDDLVTDDTVRSRGYGERMMDALVAHARNEGCIQLHLDSGVQRFAAHRFYLRRGFEIRSHHFSLVLTAEQAGNKSR